MSPPPEGLSQFFLDYAAYLVAVLAGLLYQITKERAKEDKAIYMKELDLLKGALGRTMTTEDFRQHERREDKDRDERRQAEDSIRRQVSDLDVKMDGKLNTITDALIRNSRIPQHRGRLGDTRE